MKHHLGECMGEDSPDMSSSLDVSLGVSFHFVDGVPKKDSQEAVGWMTRLRWVLV